MRSKAAILNETKCKDCKELLTIENSQFHRCRLDNTCRICQNKKSLARNKERYREDSNFYKDAKIRSKYGVTREEYNKLFEIQSGGCAICKKSSSKMLGVDHDHDTNKIRGLLCDNCNIALGHVKEDEDIIWNMLEYLKKHKWSKAA